jgi:MFS transporter, DHA3 family, tetracycline resistance protein
MRLQLKHIDAYRLYLLLEFLSALAFATYGTLSAVYRVRTAALNPLQLVLVGTVLEGSIFLCEIPTGVVADVFSRRLSIIIGTLLTGAGFVLEGALPIFATILLAQVLWGVGYTFISGAQEAWVADEIGEQRAGKAYINGAQVGRIGALLGIPLAVVLASIRLNLPLLVGGGLTLLLGCTLIATMPEHGFRPTPQEERSSWHQMGDALQGGARLVRRSPVLLTILSVGLFYGLYSEAVDRLSEAHFLLDTGFPALGRLTPVIWLGALDAVATLLSIGLTEIVKRRVDTASHTAVARTLFLSTAGMVVGLLVFGLAGSFAVAALAFLGFWLMRRLANPYYTAWVVQHTEPQVRATVISFTGQVDAFGQIAGGPLLGVVGTLGSIRAALVASAGVLAPALLLLARTLRRSDTLVVKAAEDVVATQSVSTSTT